jgi:lambda family phage portal protein
MASRAVAILGPDGREIDRKPSRARALAGGNYRGLGNPPYDAADLYDPHLAAWTPYLWSPDAEINIYRDRIVSRVRDMVRNDGWASGSVTRILDSTIGANLRPVAKPDYRMLAAMTGLSTFDHDWSKEFGRAVDAHWRSWAGDDLGHYCDVTRNQSFSQMMRAAFRHKLVDGDALAVVKWMPDRLGLGRARYATAIQLVDPDRLSNPQMRFDQLSVRGGVEIDDNGATIAYYIRKAHAGDWFSAALSVTWERVMRETAWGRPIVVHDFDGDRASQHRGGIGIFAPILQRLKMLIKYDGVELDAAIINSIFAAYVESPFDQEFVAEALDSGEKLNAYQESRAEFHTDPTHRIVLGGNRIPILFPGERINSVVANRPAGNFQNFERTVLHNVASGLGLSAKQVSNDWSDVNYSSARGALLEAWKTLSRRRDEFAAGFCAPIRGAWLEESFEEDDLPLPAGAPPFMAARNAYARARWMGPGRGWIDPVAEKQGAILGMDGALTTLEDECAEQGLEYEEVLEQRRFEVELFKEYGLPLPEWAGAAGDQTPQKQNATPTPPAPK